MANKLESEMVGTIGAAVSALVVLVTAGTVYDEEQWYTLNDKILTQAAVLAA